jgi:glycosyltransferase involved in cell wall biosynthesis
MGSIKKRVTIGLCVKNCEKTIKKSLKSILNQSFPQELVELIVVDGGSRDHTLDIIRNILSKEDIDNAILIANKGLGQARQIVVENAKGEYIIWVDGDMVLTKDFIGEHVKFMDEHPKVGIAVGQHLMSSKDNWVASLDIIEDVMDFSYNRRNTQRPLGAGGCIYRVVAIKQVGGFNCDIRGAEEDTDIENKIRTLGWALEVSPKAKFYEKPPSSWKALWIKYSWYGYGGHYALHKGLIKKRKLFPLLILLMMFSRSIFAYKLTGRKIFFLYPLHYVYKRIAWLFGFMKAHFDSYGH